jgi:hypothetical protein
MVPEGFDQGRVRESAAAARVAGMLSAESIDALLSDAKESGMALDGRDGLLGQMSAITGWISPGVGGFGPEQAEAPWRRQTGWAP